MKNLIYKVNRLMLILFVLAGALVHTACNSLNFLQPASSPTPTQFPLATWIAQGVPEDTVIKFETGNAFTGKKESVKILADGYVESVFTYIDKTNRGTGHITEAELNRILSEFAEVDFFSLDSDGQCVYNNRHPPAEGSSKIIALDSSWVRISLTINGKNKSFQFDKYCAFSDYEFVSPMKLTYMLEEIGTRFAGWPE